MVGVQLTAVGLSGYKSSSDLFIDFFYFFIFLFYPRSAPSAFTVRVNAFSSTLPQQK